VFSDPAYQALYEAYCESGMSNEDAVKKVAALLEKELAKRVNPGRPVLDNWRILRDNKYIDVDDTHANRGPYFKDVTWRENTVKEASDNMKALREYFKGMIDGESKQS